MGYMHIDNLYKNIEILMFKECYALEKIHGTSANISWKDNKLLYHSGGEKYQKFVDFFDNDKLISLFEEHFSDMDVTLFGEAYGGKQQGMSLTYGQEMKFVVFDVKIGETWLNVPNAEDVATKMGLEFVSYNKVNVTIDSLNYQRDLPSVQAIRNGIQGNKLREGVVLRPLIEMLRSDGKRIISKHKAEAFQETKTNREIIDPARLKTIEDANKIAEEWVTEMRLSHVLDKLGNPTEIEKTPIVIKAMFEDISREAEGEIKESKAAKTAIGKKAAVLYKNKISKI